MSVPVLAFHLTGPMASWGEVTTGEIRSSLPHPTRSALLGLLGAAQGIRRGDTERLAELRESLQFAVAVLASGNVLMDFHTTERHAAKRGEALLTRRAEIEHLEHRDNPNVSRRWYRCDVAYIVAVWCHRDDQGLDLDELAQALRLPEFTLFLGRKSCPLGAPLRPRLFGVTTLAEALTTYLDELPQDQPRREATMSSDHVSIYFDGFATESSVPASFLPDTVESVQRRDLPRAGFRAFAARTECRGTLNLGGAS